MTVNIVRRHVGTLAEAYKVFFEALQGDSVGGIMLAAHDFFGLPVLLTDESYRLICQYPEEPIGDPVWDTLRRDKILPVETIKLFQEELLVDVGDRHYRPFYSGEGAASGCPRIFGEVYSSRRIYGHIAVFYGSCPLEREDLDCVQVFIDALLHQMKPRHSRREQSLSACMRDLLEEDSAVQAKALAVTRLGTYLPGPYSLMVTPIGGTASQQAFSEMVLAHMSMQYRSTANTLFDNCIVTLFGLMHGETYSEKETEFFRRVSAYLSPAHTSSGISQPFTDLTELRGRFQQAYITAGITGKPFEFFDNVFPRPIFEAARSAMSDPSMFVHPALRRLLDYDRENQTDYFGTLRVYSLTMHNKESTARALGIHRNTLLYRLNRIMEQFGIPYEDPGVGLSLLNSFQLMELI